MPKSRSLGVQGRLGLKGLIQRFCFMSGKDIEVSRLRPSLVTGNMSVKCISNESFHRIYYKSASLHNYKTRLHDN